MKKKLKTKVCSKCKKRKRITEFYWHRIRHRYMESCKECNAKACLKYQQTSGYRKTLAYVFYQRAHTVRHTAMDKKVNCPFKQKGLTKYLKYLWIKQKGICYYSRRRMKLTGYGRTNFAMTVDRKIPKKGYIKNNLVLCLSIVNRMKQNLTHKQLLQWCKILILNERR